MKKIGEYTARGIVTEVQTGAGDPQKIPLFDGSFKTAYRVTSFKIWPSNVGGGSSGDAVGKLSKNASGSTGSTNFMRADDDNQIAWAGCSNSTDFFIEHTDIIDKDNLVVEDLYVYVRCATDANNINYIVTMEKYEISDWQGALAMARDRADGE